MIRHVKTRGISFLVIVVISVLHLWYKCIAILFVVRICTK